MKRALVGLLLVHATLSWGQSEPEERDPGASAGLRYEAGGPSTVGDPIRVSNLSVAHEETDLVVRTSIGEFAFSRKYASNTPWNDVWPERALFDYAMNSNGRTATTQWWSSLSSYATLIFVPTGAADDFVPNVTVQIREVSGDLVSAGGLSERLEAATFDSFDIGGAARTILSGPRDTNGRLKLDEVSSITLVRNGSGRYVYTFVGEETFGPVVHQAYGTRRKFGLYAVYPDLKGTPPICTFSQSGSGGTATCFGGELVSWSRDTGNRGRMLSLALNGQPVAQFSYASGKLSSVSRVATGEVTSYAYTGGFSVSSGVGTELRTVFHKGEAGSIRSCGPDHLNPVWFADQPAITSEATPAGGFSYQPVYPSLPDGGGVYDCFDPSDQKRTTASQTSLSGDVIRQTFTSESGSTSQVRLDCTGSCTSVSNAVASWWSNHWAAPQDVARQDYRGSWSKFDLGFVETSEYFPDSGVNPLKDTEVRTARLGAIDATGAGALVTRDYTWQYADPDGLHERLPATESAASVLQPGGTTTTYSIYDLTTKRLKAVIKSGWTRTVSGTVGEKKVGTFYFDRRVCTPGSTADPYGRTLEIHGPCFVQSVNSVDCDGEGGGAVPVTQLEYYDATAPAPKQHRLKAKRTLVGSGGTSLCGPTVLETTYDAYDAYGQVLEEKDPNGTVTTRTFLEDRLLTETVSGDGMSASTSYFYHPSQGGRLSAKRLPSAQWEVYCWRLNADANCRGSAGTLADQMQWKARIQYTGTSEPTSFTFLDKTVFTYTPRPGALANAGGGLLTREAVYKEGESSPRRLKGLAYDPLGRVSATKALDQSLATLYESATLYDEVGNVLGEGAPFNTPPGSCGGQMQDGVYKVPTSTDCTHFAYDRLSRLGSVMAHRAPSLVARTYFAYDSQGNLRQVSAGHEDLGSEQTVVEYQHDDFGNVVSITGQWMTAGASIKQEFDARGNLLKKQTPAMNGHSVVYQYDTMNRPLKAWTTNDPNTLLWLYTYDGTWASGSNCPPVASSNLKGRVQWKYDSFGYTWYAYDGLGNVTELRRVRPYWNRCSGSGEESWDQTPDTKYTYTTDGRLLTMKYPHGLRLRYTWNADVPDRLSAIETSYDGSTWSPLTRSIRYDVDGAIEAYELATTPTATSVEWLRRGSASLPVASCTQTRASADGTGRLWGLWVSKTPLSTAETSRTGNTFKRLYQWTTDQLTGQSTCLVGESTPRTELFGYDGMLQVTAATRPAGEFNNKGGPWGKREFLYTKGSDRDWATEDCVGWQSTYDPATRRLIEVHPRANGCTGTCTTDRSWGTKLLTYDADGRMTDLKDTPWPGGAGSSAGRHLVLTPDDGFGSVYRAVQVNGATYQYLYDAQGRRRKKVYPNGKDDEFFYEGDTLLEDRGVTALVTPGSEPYLLNQYVWLGGMPVAVVKTTLNASSQRVATPTQCKRNDEAEPCGTYFIVNDALPKPVALIDSAGRLAGSGEYDVFGRVNEVTVSQDTPAAPGTPPQPFGAYLPSQNTVLAYLKQPAGSAALRVQLRVKYASINTGSAGDGTWVEDGNTGAQLTPWYQGWALGQKTTPWVPVASNGLVHVRWQSDGAGESASYSGVTVGSYEYRRYEAGASPWWVPLRFPGQYADAESGLYENWNRFYDPSMGQYSASDPLRPSPSHVRGSQYAYASNNPLGRSDRDGRRDGADIRAENAAREAMRQAMERERRRAELKKKAEAALERMASVPGYEQEAKAILDDLKAGRIEPAGAFAAAMAAVNNILTGAETNAMTSPFDGAIYIVNDTPWTGLDATLCHEKSHSLDQAAGSYWTDRDRDEQGKAYQREQQYIDDRATADQRRALEFNRSVEKLRKEPAVRPSNPSGARGPRL